MIPQNNQSFSNAILEFLGDKANTSEKRKTLDVKDIEFSDLTIKVFYDSPVANINNLIEEYQEYWGIKNAKVVFAFLNTESKNIEDSFMAIKSYIGMPDNYNVSEIELPFELHTSNNEVLFVQNLECSFTKLSNLKNIMKDISSSNFI